MGRKLVTELPGGSRQLPEQVPAEQELLLGAAQAAPELLPLDELGLVGPAGVAGRESRLDSGRLHVELLNRPQADRAANIAKVPLITAR